MLQTRVIPPAEGAYQYPLLIKRLLMSGARYEKTREIIYRDKLRYTYPTLIERVARLANVLTEAGVKAGDTVAVMDWDSHRYLECMFAIPMIGAVIHTINVRLSPEQILYTMNHAEDRFVLVNSEFVGLYQAIAGQLTTVDKTLLLTDGESKTAELPNLVGEYETLLAAASPHYDFQDFDENSVATTFYTTGTTGNPRVCTSPTASWCCTPWAWRPSWAVSTACACWAPTTCTCRSHRCSTSTPGACRMWQPCSA
ncbi:medium-chain-fatty-acid--CoA ligase [Pseudomonas fluorescens]|uniref:Medium-chain-fatty-acid--CoA ligase n=1 Tax=Pseudomonas fluorescens TaxID=294 RepID=A0A8B4I1I9_PSEFL|nr:medium-chain-fatty-acid--CoA ligase [Pseudomonas fluorescens]